MLRWFTLLFCRNLVKRLVQYCVYSFTLYLERSSASRKTTLPRKLHTVWSDWISQRLIIIGVYHLVISLKEIMLECPTLEQQEYSKIQLILRSCLRTTYRFSYWKFHHSWDLQEKLLCDPKLLHTPTIRMHTLKLTAVVFSHCKKMRGLSLR